MNEIEGIIAALGLQPHPLEGGHFVETYRTPQLMPDGIRSWATCIYYLLTPGTFSHLHRLPGDEIFHFYAGDPVEMLQLLPDGTGQLITLGSDILAGQRPQVIVPGQYWQGTSLAPGSRYALLGCTMTPGFQYSDYEHAERGLLTWQYPTWADRIAALTS